LVAQIYPANPKLCAAFINVAAHEELAEPQGAHNVRMLVLNVDAVPQIDLLTGRDLLSDQLRNAPGRSVSGGRQINEILARFVTQHVIIVQVEIILRQRCLLLCARELRTPWFVVPIPARVERVEW
jgi:hypothetical protein